MKFVKDNLTLLICGVVAVLFLVFAFAPIPFAVPTLRAALTDAMKERYDHVNTIKGYEKDVLNLPGLPAASGIPPQTWVEAKKALIKNINEQQTQVEAAARAGNMKGRIKNGEPILPVPETSTPAQIEGKPLSGYLPKITRDPMAFKASYGMMFRLWRGLLATGLLAEAEDDAAMPPKQERMKADWDEQEKARIAALPPGSVQPGAVSAQNNQAFWAFEKVLVMNRAAGLRMYVEPFAFQRRAWFDLDSPPEAEQIFEAFVDSWFQSDLVKAMLAVNNQALASASQKDVGKAAIKRLTRVVIGNNARIRYLNSAAPAAGPGQLTEPGPLFFTNTNASAGGMMGPREGPSVAAGNQGVASTKPGSMIMPAAPNATDYSLGMTGRAAGKTYDVVYMSVVMDIDPAYLTKFIDQLYRQNMGYSVVNIQTRTVDPLDRASNGYLLGDGPVLEVELLIECVLFRNWTEPLMPDAEKTLLGAQPG